MKKEKMFIHAFNIGANCYIYDVNTDKILEVPEKVYEVLKKIPDYEEVLQIRDKEVRAYILNLIEHGFLKADRVQITEHPESKYVNSYINNNMTSVILQVTQNCNLRCEYCVYSGSYYNRVHNNKRMSLETAMAAIDYLAEHSSDTDVLHIGFYGGEPLLEFDLIKECVSYAKRRCNGKQLYYNLTTNGTLVTKEIVEFFLENNVLMMFSLGGPKEIHDLSRRSSSNQGSFEKLLSNIKMIKEEYPEYFSKKVSFNTVLNPERSYSCVSDYISGEELLKNNVFMSSLINTHNSKKRTQVSERFMEELRYEEFLLLLSKIEQYPKEKLSPLSRPRGMELDSLRFEKNLIGRERIPQKAHHGGPCVPGNYRIFVDVDGNFYPCERVSETSEEMKIGNLKEGIDKKQVIKIMNIEKLTEKECHNCWAYDYCNVCAANLDTSTSDPKRALLEECKSIRKSVEDKFKDYCVLKMYDYQR